MQARIFKQVVSRFYFYLSKYIYLTDFASRCI
jgi:hypothetical protein